MDDNLRNFKSFFFLFSFKSLILRSEKYSQIFSIYNPHIQPIEIRGVRSNPCSEQFSPIYGKSLCLLSCVYYHCRRFYNGFLTFQGDRALFFAALQPPISRTEFTRDEFPGLLPESASSSSAKSSGYGAMYRAILPFLKNRCKG